MTRIALIGSNGQLGSDIARIWPQSAFGRRGDELVGLTHADIEVSDPEQVHSVLRGIEPSIVINTAAFHRVDDCEAQYEQAFRVNAFSVKALAEACRQYDAVLVHFSTDYVFSGDKTTPYAETDAAVPVSAYGISKLAGEHFLRYVLPDKHLLVRSSGLYGVAGASGKGGNFVTTMLRMAAEGRPIRVVNDQVSAPTHTLDLATALLDLLAADARGTFHVTNSGACSWHDFAAAIFALAGLQPELQPITSTEYDAVARRPAYSVLANSHLGALGLAQPRPWREALAHYLRLKGVIAA